MSGDKIQKYSSTCTSIQEFPNTIGIVGKVIESKEILTIADAYNHNAYNEKVDIQTSLPVICKPILDKD